MSVTSVKPSSPSIAFDSAFTAGTGPKPGLPPKPMSPVVSPAQLQTILNANRGSSAGASITPGSLGTNDPGPTQPTTSAKPSLVEKLKQAWDVLKEVDKATGGALSGASMTPAEIEKYLKEKQRPQ